MSTSSLYLQLYDLLSLRYGDQVQRTQAAQDFAEENNTSIHEEECQIDIGLFLDEYPRWELGTPHRAIICTKCFYTPLIRGRKRWSKWSTGAAAAVYMTLILSRPICHGVSGIPYTPKRDERHLSEHLSVAKGPKPSPLVELNQEERQSRTYFLLKSRLHRCGWSTTIRDLESQDEQVELN